VTDLDALGAAKYLLLTTFRRDGRAVATPVWLARDADTLLVWTAAGSGKVKRLRNRPDVLMAPCDIRGNPSDEAIAGQGRILEGAANERAKRLIQRRYGFAGWLTFAASRLRRGANGTLCLVLTVNQP
jgi:uncharacterized protein